MERGWGPIFLGPPYCIGAAVPSCRLQEKEKMWLLKNCDKDGEFKARYIQSKGWFVDRNMYALSLWSLFFYQRDRDSLKTKRKKAR